MTTWIENLQNKISQQYQISPIITENYKLKYSKYKHRITFILVKNNTTGHYLGFDTFDYVYASRIMKLVKQERLDGTVKTRNHWIEFYIYFNENVDEYLGKFNAEILSKITEIQAMPDFVFRESNAFVHDYPVQLEIKNALPFKKYRYKIFITASCTLRKEIGRQNLNHLYNTITQYDDIRESPSFHRTQGKEMVWDEVYFYTKTLDLVPMIYLIEPRFIRNIIEFRTIEEINEPTT